MASVNRVTLIGNLGHSPELKYLPSGEAVCNFSIATTEKWKDKSGSNREETTWHKINFFGKLAEVCNEFLKKGSSVYVEGRIQTREWQDKEGNKRTSTEIKGERMQLLGKREQSDAAEPPARKSVDEMESDIPF